MCVCTRPRAPARKRLLVGASRAERRPARPGGVGGGAALGRALGRELEELQGCVPAAAGAEPGARRASASGGPLALRPSLAALPRPCRSRRSPGTRSRGEGLRGESQVGAGRGGAPGVGSAPGLLGIG